MCLGVWVLVPFLFSKIMIEHKDIADPNIHEPKGVRAANANTVYVSTGTGTGTWKKLRVSDLEGFSGSLANEGYVLRTTGVSNQFQAVLQNAYAVVHLTSNNTPMAQVAATDPTLSTNSDYKPFNVSGFSWVEGETYKATTSANTIITPVTGFYKVSLQASIGNTPMEATKVGFKIRVGGSIFTNVKAVSIGKNSSVSFSDFIPITAGTQVEGCIASTDDGNIVVTDYDIKLELLRHTP